MATCGASSPDARDARRARSCISGAAVLGQDRATGRPRGDSAPSASSVLEASHHASRSTRVGLRQAGDGARRCRVRSRAQPRHALTSSGAGPGSGGSAPHRRATPDVGSACQLRPAETDDRPGPGGRPRRPRPPGRPRDAGRRAGVAGSSSPICGGFTRMASASCCDVVYLLGRCFQAVGSAIERAGGIAPTSSTGDGTMALFGVERGPGRAARRPHRGRRA